MQDATNKSSEISGRRRSAIRPTSSVPGTDLHFYCRRPFEFHTHEEVRGEENEAARRSDSEGDRRLVSVHKGVREQIDGGLSRVEVEEKQTWQLQNWNQTAFVTSCFSNHRCFCAPANKSFQMTV